MALPPVLENRLSLPLVGAPMFLVSNPDLVLAQCRAGIVGAFPALNARPIGQLREWLDRLAGELSPADAPFAVNLIVHRTNRRLEEDLALCVEYRVPVVITSLGAREDVNAAIRGYGGITLHDVIDNRFARKAIEKGATGLIAVAAGAGGHAGRQSPFALVQEIRSWFDGPLALSGAIANGGAILAAQAMGADLAYAGSAFIATDEAEAASEYKRMIVDSHAADIIYTDLFSGVHGNYLRPSIARAGLDPDGLASSDPSRMSFDEEESGEGTGPRAWRDIWGAGQGIGAVDAVVPVARRIARWREEYAAAKARLC